MLVWGRGGLPLFLSLDARVRRVPDDAMVRRIPKDAGQLGPPILSAPVPERTGLALYMAGEGDSFLSLLFKLVVDLLNLLLGDVEGVVA